MIIECLLSESAKFHDSFSPEASKSSQKAEQAKKRHDIPSVVSGEVAARSRQLGSRNLRHIGVRSERVHGAQAAHAAQQDLELPVRGRRLVLRDHVAREIDADVRQPALRVGRSHDAGRGEGALRDLFVVRHVEGILGGGLEALGSAPGHVLDGQQRAVCDP